MMILANQSDTILILDCCPGWIAVDKPCGISVHNDPGKDLVSIVSARFHSDNQLVRRMNARPGSKLHPVHRLDKETSGVILMTCNEQTARQLAEQFTNHTVKKKYTALIHGVINTPLPPCGYHHWSMPLSKKAAGRRDPKGKKPWVTCETRYRVIETSVHYSLIDIDLISGRKHQIRRHAKLSGHPVTGDVRYGSKKSIDYLKNKCAYHHLGLHCRSIEIIDHQHPEQTITVQSKNKRQDMIHLLETDKIKN
jgi:23S rRNA-/tRNA-specific pseudouridylate synthase